MKTKNLILAALLILGTSALTTSCKGKHKNKENESINSEQNTESFNDIINGKTVVLVDFYAEWCGPCKMQSPIIDELSEELGKKFRVVKVDVDIEADLANRYEIESIPTIIVFKQGKTIWKAIGLQEKETLKQVILNAQ